MQMQTVFARSGISNSSLLIQRRGTIQTKHGCCNGNALAIGAVNALQNTIAEATVARHLLKHNVIVMCQVHSDKMHAITARRRGGWWSA